MIFMHLEGRDNRLAKNMNYFMLTTAEISDAAVAWAKQKPITLIDGPTLVQIAAELQPQKTG